MAVESGTTLDLDRLIRLRECTESCNLRPVHSDSKTGGFSGRKRGHGSDIRELRPYVEGDDVRRIDAMASARTGRRQVRTFHEDQDETVFLIADFRAPMLWGTRGRFRSVAAGEALAVAGWRTITDGGKVGLLAVNGLRDYHVPPRPRDRAMMRISGSLVRAHAEAWDVAGQPDLAPVHLDRVLERAARLVPRGATVYLAAALDDPGEDFVAVAGSLARKADLVFLLVHDSMETTPIAEALPFARLGARSPSAPVWGRLRRSGDDPRRALIPHGATVHGIDAGAPKSQRHAFGDSTT